MHLKSYKRCSYPDARSPKYQETVHSSNVTGSGQNSKIQQGKCVKSDIRERLTDGFWAETLKGRIECVVYSKSLSK